MREIDADGVAALQTLRDLRSLDLEVSFCTRTFTPLPCSVLPDKFLRRRRKACKCLHNVWAMLTEPGLSLHPCYELVPSKGHLAPKGPEEYSV